MKYGLSAKQLKEIIDILTTYEEIEQAVIYGSRAMGTFKEASDVDIAVKGGKTGWSLAAKIKSHFEDDTYLPFFFDVTPYNSIEYGELKEHIDKEGKVIYRQGWREVELGGENDTERQK